MKTEDIPYGIATPRTSNARKQSIACVAMPQRLNEEQAISLNSRFTGDQKRHPRLN